MTTPSDVVPWDTLCTHPWVAVDRGEVWRFYTKGSTRHVDMADLTFVVRGDVRLHRDEHQIPFALSQYHTITQAFVRLEPLSAATTPPEASIALSGRWREDSNNLVYQFIPQPDGTFYEPLLNIIVLRVRHAPPPCTHDLEWRYKHERRDTNRHWIVHLTPMPPELTVL